MNVFIIFLVVVFGAAGLNEDSLREHRWWVLLLCVAVATSFYSVRVVQ